MITVWLTGLPSAGKTTLARALSRRLWDEGWRNLELLDGDVLRSSPLSEDLGFSLEDRIRQARRTAYLAATLNKHGVLAIVALVSPFVAGRQAARELIPRFLEVHVKCSAKTCQERDVKGLYARAQAGEISGLTGFDAPYEDPEQADIVLDTDWWSVETCTEQLLEACRGRLAKIGFPLERGKIPTRISSL